MATIKDLQQLMIGSGIQPETVSMVITELRRNFPCEKIYVPAPDTSKKQMVIDAARRLPTGVVAQRFGVHASYVRKLIRRRS